MTVGDYIEKGHCGVGVFTNLLLIYCIRRHTRMHLGAYKHLLTIFASYDLFLTVQHEFVQPTILIVNGTFGVTSKDFDDRKIITVYVSCFSVPFALMNIHFLYRYWTASKPHLIYLFSSVPFIIFLSTLPVGVFTMWYLLCGVALRGSMSTNGTELVRLELEKLVGREVNVSHQWILMDWNDDAGIVRLVLSTFALDLIMMVALLLTIVLATLTLAGIRRAMMMSKAKGNMQLRLFISVSAQTFVPFICVYIPYACCINFPPAGIPTGLIAELCFIFTSCFPAWDAVIVIMLIGDYRHACFRMVSRFKPPTISTATNMTVAPTHMQSMAVERSVAVVTSGSYIP